MIPGDDPIDDGDVWVDPAGRGDVNDRRRWVMSGRWGGDDDGPVGYGWRPDGWGRLMGVDGGG